MKTRNLTQISLRNDPMNRRRHGFSFHVFEDENKSSRCDFSFLSRSNFDFKHLMDAKMHSEHKESNGTRNLCLDSSNFSNFKGGSFRREELYLKSNFGRDHWMKRRIAINGCDEASFD